MNDEARLLALSWDAVSDCVTNSEKQQAANLLVDAFVEGGHEIEDLYDAEGECAYLDKALAASDERRRAAEEEFDDTDEYGEDD